MIQNTIEEYLSQTFQLPVVYGLGQTMTTRSIQYAITDIKLQTRPDFSQTAYVTIDTDLRTDKGYDSIGYLSAKIAASKTTGKGWSVRITDRGERIRDMSKNDRGAGYPDSFVLSASLTFEITIHHDQVKERIKQMELIVTDNPASVIVD